MGLARLESLLSFVAADLDTRFKLQEENVMVAALLLASTLAVGGGEPAAKPGVAVEMTKGKFTPALVKIKVGETVTWTNKDSVKHSVTADPAKAKDESHVVLPAGATPFNSGPIPAGGTFSHTFTVAGRYKYFCMAHEDGGMIGEVEVAAAAGGEAPK
jgi:plastocyanin